MRSLLILPLLLLPLACASNSFIVRTQDDQKLSSRDVAANVADADVVVLGELHGTPPVHATHFELIQDLYDLRPDLVIAMEMFERDTQGAVLQYLTGVIDEPAFRVQARAPRDYARDYRPVIEFAKANGIPVIAANAPRKLAAQVAKDGVEAVAGNSDVARKTTAPEDEYWKAFAATMKDHPGVTSQMLPRYYASQCLKDDTMAESITDYLAARKDKDTNAKPLVVLICGSMHSDYGRGTVARIKSRAPALDVRVLSAEAVEDLDRGPFTSVHGVGEYVVVVKRPEPEEVVVALDDVTSEQPRPAPGTETAKAAPAPAPAPAAKGEAPDPEARPALGLMPDYGASTEGVLVASVREDGPAEKAGIQAGDVLLSLAGTRIEDVQHYAKLLDAQRIGATVPVRVKRGTGEIEVQVKLGARGGPR